MCVYSAVMDGIGRVPLTDWTSESFGIMKILLQQTKELDKKLNQPDCEDPEKVKVLAKIERHLRMREVHKREQELFKVSEALDDALLKYNTLPSISTVSVLVDEAGHLHDTAMALQIKMQDVERY